MAVLQNFKKHSFLSMFVSDVIIQNITVRFYTGVLT